MDIRFSLVSCNRRLGNGHESLSPANSRTVKPTQRHTFRTALAILSLATLSGVNLAKEGIIPQVAQAQAAPQSAIGKGVAFTCKDSEATIKARGATSLKFGQTSIYIGYQQVSSTNKDPRIVRFDNGVKRWCRSDYETTGDDGTGYGLMWDGGSVLYGVFSSTGTQTGNDFRRFATSRWLPSYGSGGGAKVAVIARINLTNGDVNYATFVSSRKASDGKTNSLRVKGLSWTGTSIVVQTDSWWTPRRADKNSMTCSGSSPYNYTIEFASDLKTVKRASATGCS